MYPDIRLFSNEIKKSFQLCSLYSNVTWPVIVCINNCDIHLCNFLTQTCSKCKVNFFFITSFFLLFSACIELFLILHFCPFVNLAKLLVCHAVNNHYYKFKLINQNILVSWWLEIPAHGFSYFFSILSFSAL